MEADSTTYENNSKSSDDICLPFSSNPEDLKFYKVLISHIGNCSLESQLIEKLQSLGLIPEKVTCPENKPDCKVSLKSARVVDRFQWLCKGCGKRLPIRTGTFFFRLQCSILQALQIIFAWCEDADVYTAAQFFDVKPKVACSIYDRLDELAIEQLHKYKLGGENAVVMSEMYPDCLNRLSPDTTDQAHVHQILMMADTKHIPTYYKLHVIQRDPKRLRSNTDKDEFLEEEIKASLLRVAKPGSMLVTGNNVPLIDRTVPLQQVIAHCNVNMQHFLCSRIWRQALVLCSAARELCSGAADSCSAPLQRYLDTASYRLRHPRHFYEHTLRALAADVTHPALLDCF
ncbi:uncharacterized protein LOC123653746 [Melitaea cinxia]|uniref:uncharacterized protein LOC123653746 n=1 Tax=Melitaea cinxia TaxID=113334 RepID=UPI001E274961|nr:uncharacterized protein LOC123653746 [Melitaea cinxia]